jgi:uncharacterized membrane protein
MGLRQHGDGMEAEMKELSGKLAYLIELHNWRFLHAIRGAIRALGILFLFAQFMDIATTLLGVFYIGGTELNPILAPFVKTWVMPVLKTNIGMLMPLFAFWLSTKYDDLPWNLGILLFMVLVIIISFSAVIWNLNQLFQVYSLRI